MRWPQPTSDTERTESIDTQTLVGAHPRPRRDAPTGSRNSTKLDAARYGRGMERHLDDPEREKTLGNVGIPRVFFVAGAGFEPATFGL